jgi:hypothetical protein
VSRRIVWSRLNAVRLQNSEMSRSSYLELTVSNDPLSIGRLCEDSGRAISTALRQRDPNMAIDPEIRSTSILTISLGDFSHLVYAIEAHVKEDEHPKESEAEEPVSQTRQANGRESGQNDRISSDCG